MIAFTMANLNQFYASLLNNEIVIKVLHAPRICTQLWLDPTERLSQLCVTSATDDEMVIESPCETHRDGGSVRWLGVAVHKELSVNLSDKFQFYATLVNVDPTIIEPNKSFHDWRRRKLKIMQSMASDMTPKLLAEKNVNNKNANFHFVIQ